jgi:hypothetical protein
VAKYIAFNRNYKRFTSGFYKAREIASIAYGCTICVTIEGCLVLYCDNMYSLNGRVGSMTLFGVW